MPVSIPTYDETTHELVPVAYYNPTEVAEMLPISETTVRRLLTEQAWPHVVFSGHRFMSAEQIGRAVELAMVDPDAIPEGDEPARLGTPMTDTDLESVT